MVAITQREIARRAKTSQATVSLVVNGNAEGRVAPTTVARVQQVIRQTGYVANPAARQLVAGGNHIVGVFTYENIFPAETADFYHPFLVGIETAAVKQGWDLLLLTSIPEVDGRRRLFHERSRLRIADGCIVLGRVIEPEDLARLNQIGFPYVSVGRRADCPGPVPYVGADYAGVTEHLTRRALELGHRHFAYLEAGPRAESGEDRKRGFLRALGRRRVSVTELATRATTPARTLAAVRAAGATAAFVEDGFDGDALAAAAADAGVGVPAELSLVLLGELPTHRVSATDLTRFAIPRHEMGHRAIGVLADRMRGGPVTGAQQLTLDCRPVAGMTLAWANVPPTTEGKR